MGRAVGKLVADQAWAKAVLLWRGDKTGDEGKSGNNPEP
jgi:hypothetical protein